MVSSAEQIRRWKGPAILSYGYRPFFLLGAISAALSMVLWVLALSGHDILYSAFDSISWHAHSFLFSYLWALVAGFLMTAVPNWTGRLPIVGWRLALLVALWLLSWLAVASSNALPYWLTIALDLVFPIVLVIAIGREIIAGKNWRNFKMLVIIILLIVANFTFDFEALYLGYGADGYGARFAVCFAILLITLIGGRIVPSFTRNWLAKHHATKLPVQFCQEDKIILLLTALSLIFWALMPDNKWVATLAIVAGVANLRRLYRWRGWETWRDPLVAILHIAFLFVPIGFLAIGLDTILLQQSTRASVQHFWMAGAIGLMTMAIMTRASLGHSGRPLHISWPVVTIYIGLFASVLLRVVSGFCDNTTPFLHSAAALWAYAFLAFVVLYWPILTRPRLSN